MSPFRRAGNRDYSKPADSESDGAQRHRMRPQLARRVGRASIDSDTLMFYTNAIIKEPDSRRTERKRS